MVSMVHVKKKSVADIVLRRAMFGFGAVSVRVGHQLPAYHAQIGASPSF